MSEVNRITASGSHGSDVQLEESNRTPRRIAVRGRMGTISADYAGRYVEYSVVYRMVKVGWPRPRPK
jgi:hypothetical protein